MGCKSSKADATAPVQGTQGNPEKTLLAGASGVEGEAMKTEGVVPAETATAPPQAAAAGEATTETKAEEPQPEAEEPQPEAREASAPPPVAPRPTEEAPEAPQEAAAPAPRTAEEPTPASAVEPPVAADKALPAWSCYRPCSCQREELDFEARDLVEPGAKGWDQPKAPQDLPPEPMTTAELDRPKGEANIGEVADEAEADAIHEKAVGEPPIETREPEQTEEAVAKGPEEEKAEAAGEAPVETKGPEQTERAGAKGPEEAKNGQEAQAPQEASAPQEKAEVVPEAAKVEVVPEAAKVDAAPEGAPHPAAEVRAATA